MSKELDSVRDLVPESTATSNEFLSWQEIDGWEDPTHTVSIWWFQKDGEDHFRLGLEPKTGYSPVGVEVDFDEVQHVRHEHHTYPYVAPKAGHLATIQALGIFEAEAA